MRTIYLDNNATSRPHERVIEAMLGALRDEWHNPSSIHRPGQAARRRVELARQSVARLINAKPQEITFTSGGTESIDLAIRGVLGARRGGAGNAGPPIVVTTGVEHAAVRDLLKSLAERGAREVREAPLGRGGAIDVARFGELLDERVALVSVQWANNETGVVQPIDAIGAACRGRRIPFHCDGAQWVGKAPVDVAGAPFDLLSISAHKWHGPKGIGALWVRRGARIAPVLHGAHEGGRRGGTENVPGIVGFAAAADLAREWLGKAAERERLAGVRDRFERGVLARCPGAIVNGGSVERLWNTSNVAFPRLEAEALLIALSERGVCASAGAACSSGSLEPSPVLLAMGIPPELAHGSLRFSLSRESTDQEIDKAVEVIAAVVDRVRGSTAAVV